jgi:UDPglucose 6-dehydrogenase
MGTFGLFSRGKDSSMIIAGYGFVGKAQELLFKDVRREIVIHDPPQGMFADFSDASAVVICVPTPELESGACDISAVYDVISQCNQTTPIMIKSTISLQGWEYLKETFPNHRLCFSPEFLRAANYMNDIKNIDNVILSGDTDYWRDQFNFNWTNIKINIVSPEEAIAIKYFRNAYLATKVSFFNEVHDFCVAYGIDFNQVRGGIAADTRIGESHTYVWPDDGVRGWGGACFPKDTKALLKMAAEKNMNLNTLGAAVYYNTKIKNNT